MNKLNSLLIDMHTCKTENITALDRIYKKLIPKIKQLERELELAKEEQEILGKNQRDAEILYYDAMSNKGLKL